MPVFTRFIFALAAAAPVLLRAAEASSTADSSAFEGRVTVLADRASLLLAAHESKVVITPEAWEGTGKTLADVLTEQSGIQTRRYGGLGSFQSISIRGVPGAHVLVYLDDLPLNSAGGGPVDLSKIDLQSIERVEVTKGVTPARFGGNGLAGVVQLVTRRSRNAAPVKAATLFGSHGTEKHSVSAGFPLGEAVRLTTSLAYEYSRNDFDFESRNATPYNYSDDFWTTRKNSDYRSLEGLYRVTGESLRGLHWDLSLQHSNNRGGLPGTESQQTRTSGFENSDHRIEVSVRRQSSGSPVLQWWRTLAAWEREAPRYFWSLDDGIGWTTTSPFTDLGSINTRWTGRLESGFSPFAWLNGEAYLTGVSENLVPKDFTGSGGTDQWENRRRSVTASTDLRAGPFRGFSITAGYHIEGVEDHTQGGATYYGTPFPSADTLQIHQAGRLGVNWKASGPLLIFANAARYYRVPSLLERYGGRMGVLPNPDLKPEGGVSGDAGVKWDFGEGFLEASGFLTLNDEVIVYLHSASVMKPANLETSKTQGIELTGYWKPLAWTSFSANGTFQDPRIVKGAYRYEGNQIPNEPLLSTYGKIVVGPFARVELHYSLEGKSELFHDVANTPPVIPPQLLQHLSIHYLALAGAKLHFEVQNLTGETYVDPYSPYPLPGRQYFAGFTFQFKKNQLNKEKE